MYLLTTGCVLWLSLSIKYLRYESIIQLMELEELKLLKRLYDEGNNGKKWIIVCKGNSHDYEKLLNLCKDLQRENLLQFTVQHPNEFIIFGENKPKKNLQNADLRAKIKSKGIAIIKKLG